MQCPKELVISEVKESKKLKPCEKYVEFGYSVIPLKPKDKRPQISWTEYQKRRANIEEIKEWFRTNPDINIGIVTGKISNLVVLDVDGKEGMRTLRKNHCEIPETTKVKTGKGYHYYFKYPKGSEVGNFVGILPSVDIRGEGGYIVAPPSIHSTGVKYEWLRFCEPKEIPDWLLKLITNSRGGISTQKNQSKISLEEGINTGERNNTLTRITGHLLAKEVNTRLTFVLIKSLNRFACNPPLEEQEVETIVKSIASKELGRVK